MGVKMQSTKHQKSTLRNKIFINLDPVSWPHSGLSPLNKIITLVVLICVISAILETEPIIAKPYATIFSILNDIFLYIFTVEYLFRLWVMGENSRYSGIKGRFLYIFSLPALIDLVTILPFWFGAGSEILLLRTLRLLRILKLIRIPSVQLALERLKKAIISRRMEFIICISFAMLLVLLAATTLYLFEGSEQPDKFGSIPRSLWWGVATLTTVGYGDVYPVTVFGKIAAALYAIAGIGLIAMPTGVFAAAMADVVDKPQKKDEL